MDTRTDPIKVVGEYKNDKTYERIKEVIDLNNGYYLTPLNHSRNMIKIWHNENDERLNYQDIYINVTAEMLNTIKFSKEIVLSRTRESMNAIVEYAAHFANGFILLKLSNIRNCDYEFFCLFDPDTLKATLIKISERTNHFPFDAEHFITFLQQDKKYYLLLWNIVSRQQVKKLEVSRRDYSTISGAVEYRGELIFDSARYSYFKAYSGAPLSILAKDTFLLSEQTSLEIDSSDLRRLDNKRSLLLLHNKIAILSEHENKLVLTPCVIPEMQLFKSYFRYSKVLSSSDFLFQSIEKHTEEKSDEPLSKLYVYNLNNPENPQKVFAVTSEIQFIKDAQQIHQILVVVGKTSSDQHIVECWDIAMGRRVSIDYPSVSLVTLPTPKGPPQRYPGEWEGAIIQPPPVRSTIMTNGEVVYWQEGERVIESFSFQAIRQAHDLTVKRALDSWIMPDKVKKLVLNYSIFSCQPVEDEVASVPDEKLRVKLGS